MRTTLRVLGFATLLFALWLRLLDITQHAQPPIALAPNATERLAAHPLMLFRPAPVPYWPRLWPEIP